MVIRINIYYGHSSQCTRLHLAPAGVGKHLSTGNTGGQPGARRPGFRVDTPSPPSAALLWPLGTPRGQSRTQNCRRKPPTLGGCTGHRCPFPSKGRTRCLTRAGGSVQCARGGVWVSGRQGCPASGQEDVLAAEARPLSLVPPSSVAGWDAGHLLVADQPPGRDMPRGRGGVPRGKFRSGGIKSSTPEAELLQRESNPRVARALGEQLLPLRRHLPAEGVPRTRSHSSLRF